MKLVMSVAVWWKIDIILFEKVPDKQMDGQKYISGCWFTFATENDHIVAVMQQDYWMWIMRGILNQQYKGCLIKYRKRSIVYHFQFLIKKTFILIKLDYFIDSLNLCYFVVTPFYNIINICINIIQVHISCCNKL